MTKKEMIEKLIKDYNDYLSDFNKEELNLIISANVFTLPDAIQKK